MLVKKVLSMIISILMSLMLYKVVLAEPYTECYGFDEDFNASYLQLRSPIRNMDLDLTDNWLLINSKFSQPRNVIGTTPHRGIDCPGIFDVYPVAPGIIRYIHFNNTEASSKANLCRVIIQLDLDTDGNYEDVYQVVTHLQNIARNKNKTPAIKEGMIVDTNTLIGTSGQWYNAYHLHWGFTNNTNAHTGQGEAYNSLKWFPAQKYYRNVIDWRNGHDCDFLSDLTFDQQTNKVSVYCYTCDNEESPFRQLPREIVLFYRIHGTSLWQPPINMQITTTFGLYSVSLPSDCVGEQVDILIRAERRKSGDYYKYGWFPAKYYQPDLNPNDTSHPYAFYTVQCGGFDTISPGETKSVDSPTGTTKEYKLTIDKNATYAIATSLYSAPCTTTIKLLDADKNQIAIDSGGDNGYARLKQLLAPGTYYIDVLETGNDASINCKLTVGAYETINPSFYKAIEEPAGFTKFFQLNISSNGTYVIETSQIEDPGETTLTLYDSNYNQIVVDGGTPGVYAKIERTLAAGTYFLELKKSNNNPPLECILSILELILPGETKTLDFPDGQTRIYGLRIGSGGSYNIGTQFYNQYCDTNLSIFDSNWTLNASNIKDGPNKNIFINLTAGNYYIEITEKNNAPLKCSLSVSSSSLEYIYPGETKFINQTTGLNKRYQLIINQEDGTYNIETGNYIAPSCDTTLTLYDTNNNPIAYESGGPGIYGKISNILLPVGNYFIEVQEYENNGPINCSLTVSAPQYEEINPGEDKTFNLAAGQSKIYQLNINTFRTYYIQATYSELYLYDSNWNQIANDPEGGGYQFQKLLSPGIYYIKEKNTYFSVGQFNLYVNYALVNQVPIYPGDTKNISFSDYLGHVASYELVIDTPGEYSVETQYYLSSCDPVVNITLLPSTFYAKAGGLNQYGSVTKTFVRGSYLLNIEDYNDNQYLACILNVYPTTVNTGQINVNSANNSATDTISGTDQLIIANTEQAYPESPHPYPDNYDNTWSYTISGASRLKVTFDSLTEVESGFDRIYIMDGRGINISGSPFTDNSLAGQTVTVSGDTIKIRLVGDNGVAKYGFQVTDVIGVCPSPYFYPASGSYSGPQNVVVTCGNQDAVIHYTTDGSDPTESSMIVGSGSEISVDRSMLLKVRVFKTGWEASEIISAEYNISGTTGLLTAPVFNIKSGTYDNPQTIVISCVNSGATIHYTIDGNDPTENSPVYTEPIVIFGNMVLKAKTFLNGWGPSEVTSETYNFQVAPPAINIQSALNDNTYATVLVTCATQDAVIRYTTDGSEPNASSNQYFEPLTIFMNSTIKAKAFKSGWQESIVASATTSVNVKAPYIFPEGGVFNQTQVVTICSPTAEAEIHYTTDGTDPVLSSSLYSGPITVTGNMTIKTKAFKAGLNDSSIQCAAYTITGQSVLPESGHSYADSCDQLWTYIFNPNTKLMRVTFDALTEVEEGFDYLYIMDGSGKNIPGSPFTGTTLANQTVNVPGGVLKIRLTSDDSTVKYGFKVTDITDDAVSNPVIAPNGGDFSSPQNVIVTCETPGAIIHYTLDGKEPLASDPSVTSGSVILVNQSSALKVKAFKEGYPPSNISSAEFIIIGTNGQTAIPIFSVNGGTTISPQTVTIDCSTTGAVINYTTDGNEPSETSPVYQGSIVINETMTLKARAFKNDWTPSAINSVIFNKASGLYVNSNAAGPVRDGSSWDNAYRTINEAINAASQNAEIWVAAGTYLECVILKDTIAVYGGFSETESVKEQRDWNINFSIIDGYQKDSAVKLPTDSTATRIDGLVIRNGYSFQGGGVNCAANSSGIIANNMITGNSANQGGGISIQNSSAVIISGNTITGNFAATGAGIHTKGSTPEIKNNTITANTAEQSGGGIQCYFNSSPLICNNLIVNNIAYDGGSGISCSDSSPEIINNTFAGNDGGSGIYYENSAPTIANNIIAYGSTGITQYSCNGQPVIKNNCVFGHTSEDYSEGLQPGTGDFSDAAPLFMDRATGDYRLQNTSPCINKGDDSAVRTGWSDLIGNTRIQGNHVDIGAYESNPVPVPTFSPEGGIYDPNQIVTINCVTNSAIIYYTIDGSDPTTASSVYNSPITINTTTVLKAIAVVTTWNYSAVGTAVYTIAEYTIDLSCTGNGSVIKNPAQTNYHKNDIVTLTAVPDIGWTFDHWEGDLNGGVNPAAITISGNTAINAVFVRVVYSMDATIVGNGTIIKQPDNSGFYYNDLVTLTAVPDVGWAFDHWEGDWVGDSNPANITIDGNKNIRAVFCDTSIPLCLTGLVISQGSLSPAFSSDIFSYNASVPYDVDQITLTPTIIPSTAHVKINGIVVVSGQTSEPINLNVGSNAITVQVTPFVGDPQNYTITVTRASSAYLASIAGVPNINPYFDKNVFKYNSSVPFSISAIKITPIAEDPNATITINGVVVISGEKSPMITIKPGDNIINMIVTSLIGNEQKIYSINVKRPCLIRLVLSSGSLNPDFSSEINDYYANVKYDFTSITVTPTAGDSNATITVNGMAVTSGQASEPINLDVGNNTITVQVTPLNSEPQNYTITVTRASSPYLDGLIIVDMRGGGISPTFSKTTYNYASSVPNSKINANILPTAEDSNATITVNGIVVQSGQSQLIDLNVGDNTVTIIISSQTGTDQKTYMIIITRSE
jgi:hypothetical protein